MPGGLDSETIGIELMRACEKPRGHRDDPAGGGIDHHEQSESAPDGNRTYAEGRMESRLVDEDGGEEQDEPDIENAKGHVLDDMPALEVADLVREDGDQLPDGVIADEGVEEDDFFSGTEAGEKGIRFRGAL